MSRASKSKHTGYYQCFAGNEHGHSAATWFVNVSNTPLFSPGVPGVNGASGGAAYELLELSPGNTTACLDETVVLHCKPRIPSTQITWLHNDVPLAQGDTRYLPLPNSLMVFALEVNSPDHIRGKYTCIVTVNGRSERAEAWLTILPAKLGPNCQPTRMQPAPPTSSPLNLASTVPQSCMSPRLFLLFWHFPPSV